MIYDDFQLNKTYDFVIENYAFGNLSEEQLVAIYQDGRFASPFLEKQLECWFSQLKHVTGNKDHDHIHRVTGQKYDAKNFTKNGMGFMPSNQRGASRTFNYKATQKKASKLVYIVCDIVDFPAVRVKFLNGIELLENYPKAKIKAREREGLFT
jgi:hypothetical protein